MLTYLDSKILDYCNKKPIKIGMVHQEHIDWRIIKIEETEALLISNKIIHTMPFGKTNDYENSQLREWLNTYAISNFFSLAEQNNMIRKNRFGLTDKLFLLNVEEAETLFINDTDRVASAFGFVKEMGIWLGTRDYSEWWLMNQGTKPNFSRIILSTGSTGEDGTISTKTGIGVRPAMYYSLYNLGFNNFEINCFSFILENIHNRHTKYNTDEIEIILNVIDKNINEIKNSAFDRKNELIDIYEEAKKYFSKLI